MKALRYTYKVIRSILFAAVLTVAGLYIILYLLISIPAVQTKLKNLAQKEASAFLKAPVTVQELEIMPFNEVILSGVTARTPKGEKCLYIDRIGAGISLWALVFDGRIELTYAELIGMDASIRQNKEGENLNIQYIIDAFKPKEQKESSLFDVKLQNVVIRKSKVSFNRDWQPKKPAGEFDVNHIDISNLRADIAIPILKNEEYKLDLRRLSFRERNGFYLDDLSFKAYATPKKIKLNDFHLKMKDGTITLNDQDFDITGFASIPSVAKTRIWDIQITGHEISPDELSCFYPGLNNFSGSYDFKVLANGTLNDLTIRDFNISSSNQPLAITLNGKVTGLPDLSTLSGTVGKFTFLAGQEILKSTSRMINKFPAGIQDILSDLGYLNIDAVGSFNLAHKKGMLSGEVSTAQGDISVDADVLWNDNRNLSGKAEITTDGFTLGTLLKAQPVGYVSGNISSDFNIKGKDINGDLTAYIERLEIAGTPLQNIEISGNKDKDKANLSLNIDSRAIIAEIIASSVLAGKESEWHLNGSIDKFDSSDIRALAKYPATWRLGNIALDLTGNNPDNITGHISLDNLSCLPTKGKRWELNALRVAAMDIGDTKKLLLHSDIINGELSGHFKTNDIKEIVTGIASHSLPYYIKPPSGLPSDLNYLDFNLELKPYTEFYEAINIGIIPLRQTSITGSLADNGLSIDVDAPLIGQGKGKIKLIRNSKLNLSGSVASGITIKGNTSLPVKNGYMNALINANVFDNKAGISFGWSTDGNTNSGTLHFTGAIQEDDVLSFGNAGKLVNTGKKNPIFVLKVHDSELVLNDAKWEVAPARIVYAKETLIIDDLKIGNGSQFLDISGRASRSPSDSIVANLRDIDLSYIFNTLNINYVTFGGMATGKAVASNIFSKSPYASTKGLKVKNLSYNNAVLGDGELLGYWDNENKSVGIHADITGEKDVWTKVRGNIFVTRDSLGLNFDTSKANLALIQPFLANVLEKVEGQATAKLTLYGTFSDITLVGKAFADTAAVKIGFTNVTYHGSDSVLFHKDKIVIPGFRVFDSYGNNALFSGTVSHNYFHDAYIDLNVSDINKILCLDIDSRQSPIWYGRIFGSGSGKISGRPGYTMVSFNVSTEPKSDFTFVLDENKTAAEYTFLTFTDRRREAMEMKVVDKYELSMPQVENTDDSMFELDLGIGINNGIKMNVIMDPSAGDKISALGNGAMRIHYDSKGDKLDMYGRYTLSEGNYQFSFQDLILRDFTIKPGSSVMFNGDPLAGILDITAAYRVNANLSDLDKSFSNDPDLNRSSVPVEALLKVSGPLSTPDIAFDIDLPTVTGNVERKVRSIVSSEEMLNQQVLYLLALNRFYTPQFAGSSDGDLMSVASSTLSSQISNIMSQITDKVWLSPSFKSDRNDFSDMEVDLALSSQLFDNRLIINGNLGYRDRSVSNTNFIGDFDIEYLLNKRGNLRLKAYNHFNDAYYYLKSALTTQGIGIIYRKDFDDAFAFLRHKPKWFSKKKENKAASDSVIKNRHDTDKSK